MHYDAGSGMTRTNGRNFAVAMMLNWRPTAKLGVLFWIWPESRTSPCSTVRMTLSTTMPWQSGRFLRSDKATANAGVYDLAMISQDTTRKRLLVPVRSLLSDLVLPKKALALKKLIFK